MARLILLAFFCAVASCAGAGAPAKACDVTDLVEVFNDPQKYDRMTFCGEALAFPEGLVIKIFPPGIVPEERNDIVLILNRKTEERLRRLGVDGPSRIFLEGRLEPMRECFPRNDNPAEATCSPYSRPISMSVRKIRVL